ncbi:FAD dependent oxidoreductase protein [Rutstroemia sp. NJR-2017a BBW]|nr:FAD dependent oxidoreductase protein [Rutstroemia sp. NJR-2017a BBW]
MAITHPWVPISQPTQETVARCHDFIDVLKDGVRCSTVSVEDVIDPSIRGARITAVLINNHLSFTGTPLTTPTATSPHILIVGGGVTSHITSWVLLDAGYRATILSKEWVSYGKEQRITSQIAGALWEFPLALCGQHHDPISLDHSKRWCMIAYEVWDHITSDPDLSTASGVRMKKSAFFFPYNCVDAYELLAPITDTDKAMSWLTKLVTDKEAKRISEAIHGDLLDCEDQLRARFNADVIINTTGLAAQELASDSSCYPIRGAVIRVINDGARFPKVDAALSISADILSEHTSNEIIFIVPRSDRILLLGGVSEPHKWKLDYTLDLPVIQRMKERCEKFLPGLEHAELDEEYPLAQGLRPFRKNNVLLEWELRPRSRGESLDDEKDGDNTVSRIIRSYGHRGAGWSLSFGCAGDVLELVKEVLAGVLLDL